MTETAPTPILTVTWDTVIGARHVGYDPDSGPEVEPVSLGEMVVAGIVERLVADIKKDSTAYRNAVSDARQAASDATATEAAQLVREALTGEIRQTNQWGESRGEPTTLRDLIRSDVTAYLNEKTPDRNSFDRERPAGFRALLRAEIDEAMSKELRGTVQDAREQVVTKVRDNAARIIADSVKAGLR